jgi:hypothetical protein
VFKATIAIKTLVKYDHQQASKALRKRISQCFYDVHDCQSHESLIIKCCKLQPNCNLQLNFPNEKF